MQGLGAMPLGARRLDARRWLSYRWCKRSSWRLFWIGAADGDRERFTQRLAGCGEAVAGIGEQVEACAYRVPGVGHLGANHPLRLLVALRLALGAFLIERLTPGIERDSSDDDPGGEYFIGAARGDEHALRGDTSGALSGACPYNALHVDDVALRRAVLAEVIEQILHRSKEQMNRCCRPTHSAYGET
jgi:hypothetical protein